MRILYTSADAENDDFNITIYGMAMEIARHNEVTVAAPNIILIKRLFESIPGVTLSELKLKVNFANLASARRQSGEC